MLARYLLSLLLSLGIVCAILVRLPFAALSQVRAGSSFEETWTADFTLPAGAPNRYHIIDPKLKAYLEKGLALVGTGAVRVRSATFTLNPKEVALRSGKYTTQAPGASLVVQVAWDVPPDAADGEKGTIHIEFPILWGGKRGLADFHNGSFQKTAGGAWIFREVTAHQGDASLELGRFRFVVVAGVSIVFFLHGIAWLFQIVKEQRARMAALGPLSENRLGYAFWPSPTGAWWGWTLPLVMINFIGALAVGISVSSGFMSSGIASALLIVQGFSVVVGVVVVLISLAKAVTVKTLDNNLVTGHWMKKSMAGRPAKTGGKTLGPRQVIARLRVPFTLRRREAAASWQSAKEVMASEEVRELFAALAQATAAGEEPRERIEGVDMTHSYRTEFQRDINEEVQVNGSTGIWFDHSFPKPKLEVISDFRLIHRATVEPTDTGPLWSIVGLLCLQLLAGCAVVFYQPERLPELLTLLPFVVVVNLVGMIFWLIKRVNARCTEAERKLDASYLKKDAAGAAEFRKYAEALLQTLRTIEGVSVGEMALESARKFTERPAWLEGLDAKLQPLGSWVRRTYPGYRR
jgi:hypothetical protein